SVSASLTGQTDSKSFTIQAATLKRATVTPRRVPGGQSPVLAAILSGAAPAGGLTFPISSSSPAVIVPPSITVPAGEKRAEVPIQTSAVTQKTNVSIQVGTGAVAQSATVIVLP